MSAEKTGSSPMMLASSADVEELLDRLAAQIRPDVGERTALVGILRRGAPLAQRLAERLTRSTGLQIQVGELALKRYSDDLQLLHERPQLDERTLDLDVRDRHLVLVDDVLYTGESLFRAACHLRAAGARRLQTAVLCARGRPTMPIRRDFGGLQLDVGPNSIIKCHVPPYEDDLGIFLTGAGHLSAE